MKKRLLSMLMAVLMIASLVPATALAAGTHTDAHKVTKVVSINVDAAAKQPGVDVVYCDTCKEYLETVTPFAEKSAVNKCYHEWKTVELQKATCEQVGITLTYCVNCGTEKANGLEVKKALDHVYSEFTVVVKPTCVNEGWGYTVCDNCKNPVFVGGADAAVTRLTQNKDVKVSTAKMNAVYAQFAPVNPRHADKDAFVTPEKDVYNENGTIKYHAASEPAHDYATVGGLGSPLYAYKIELVNGRASIVRYDADVNGTRGTAGHEGDSYCPYCEAAGVANVKDGSVVKGAALDSLFVAHKAKGALSIAKEDVGYYPYVDAKGVKHDGKTDRIYCSICKEYFGGDVLPFDEYVDLNKVTEVGATWTQPAVAATCCAEGQTEQVWTYTDAGWAITKKAEVVEKLDHNFVPAADVPATCTKDGQQYYNYYVCTNTWKDADGKTVKCQETKGNADVYKPIPAGHNYVVKELVPATCSTNGLSVKACTVCGAYLAHSDFIVKALPHTAAADLANVKDATCTEAGYTGDTVCKWCGKVMAAGKEVPALGHTPEEVAAVAATCTETGLTAGSKCSVCGEVLTAQEVVPALGHDFKDGKCTRCGAADPNYVVPNPFKDVEKTSPYYDAIIWAAKEEITTGKTADTFGINEGCTRAQIVTFLYRAAGSPEVKADTVNPFTDVSKDSVYYNAILWAVENGITKGTTDTTFDPNAVCTRGQIVTFLFRASGDEKVATGTNFADVASGSYCADAVAWAVANDVTNGFADGTFRPEATCTRGQAVTFIYRALAE